MNYVFTIQDIGIIVAIATGLLSLYKSAVVDARERGAMKLMVDTMWDFQIKRAETEAVRRGVAVRNSPLQVTDEAKQWMKPLLGPIREFYEKLGRNLTERELYMEIERRFGDKIKEEVCIPRGLDQGACLLIAVQALRDPTL